ncbi:MAG: hypothetical protein ABI579_02370 [Candidatus Sumerlaeota bacterium]
MWHRSALLVILILLLSGKLFADNVQLSVFEMLSFISYKQGEVPGRFTYVLEDWVGDYVSAPIPPPEDRPTTMGLNHKYNLIERPGLQRLNVQTNFSPNEAHEELQKFITAVGGYTLIEYKSEKIAFVINDDLLQSKDWMLNRSLDASRSISSTHDFVRYLHEKGGLNHDLIGITSPIFGEKEITDEAFSLGGCTTIRDGIVRLLTTFDVSESYRILKPLPDQTYSSKRTPESWTTWELPPRTLEKIATDRQTSETKMSGDDEPIRILRKSGGQKPSSMRKH